MRLANDIKRALGRRRAGPWRANGYAVGIRKGFVKLNSLTHLAREAKCSLVYLVSGGNFEEDGPTDVRDAVLKSIMHGGYEKHDFARKMGYRDYNYVAAMLRDGTVPVKVLMKFAETLHLEIWELFCDSECHKVDYDSGVPTQWDQMVELNLMGWLDSKRREDYEKKGGPGI